MTAIGVFVTCVGCLLSHVIYANDLLFWFNFEFEKPNADMNNELMVLS